MSFDSDNPTDDASLSLFGDPKARVSKKPGRRSLRHRNRYEEPMDDIHVFKPDAVPQNEVVLGVYGSKEWVTADHLRSRHLAGRQTLEVQATFLTPSGFNLGQWVLEQRVPSFTFYSHDHVVIPSTAGTVEISYTKGKILITVSGDPELCDAWMHRIGGQFPKAENLIEWVYNRRGDEISVPLNYRPAIQAAYPWLDKPVLSYIDDYIDSEACVLILIGPPGTGKTTFIKNLIHRAGGNAKVAYDEEVLKGDDFFAQFMESQSNFLIMEDADSFLSSRQDGNTMMHKFLNVSDGLISIKDKKVVFSTNLPNISDIDSALLRPGRCFDVLEFRPLTRKEAQGVLDEVGAKEPLRDGSEFTLAEIFGQQPSEGKHRKRGAGFV